MGIKKKTISIGNKNFILRKLRTNDELMLKRFFSSLSPETKKWYSPHPFDNKTAENYEFLKENSPICKVSKKLQDNYGFRLDAKIMSELNVPCANIGPYGFDAHKATERVEKEYSFKIVPKILTDFAVQYLNSCHNASESNRDHILKKEVISK